MRRTRAALLSLFFVLVGLTATSTASANLLVVRVLPTTFQPNWLASTSLWLDSRAGISLSGSSVSAWTDLGGTGHAAAQATGAKKPSFSTSAGPSGGPAVTFDGVSQVLQGSWTQFQPVERYVVAKYLSGTTGTICDSGSGLTNAARFYRSAAGTWNLFASGDPLTISSGYTSANWNVYGALMSGSSSKMFLNGTNPVSGTTGTTQPAGITLGTFGDGASDPANVAIVMVIDFTTALSSAQRTVLNNYFVALYGAGL